MIYYGLGFLLVSLVGGLLVEWLSNRPSNHKQYTSEEIEKEFEEAFIERESVEVSTTQEYFPLLVEEIKKNLEAGFPDSQVAALIHRVSTQRIHVYRSAVFPVKVNGVSSDMELQWIRPNQERISMLVTADPGIIKAVKEGVAHLPGSALV